MKKILTLLGTITLIGASTTSLVACDKVAEYTQEELKKLKEKNNIKTKDGVLEWIAPQEKPFNQVDNKYYFVIWRNDNSGDWKINKFNNNVKLNTGQSYSISKNLFLRNGNFAFDLKIDLQVILKNEVWLQWFFDRDSTFFKSVYCWNKDSESNTPVIDPKTGKITN